jgi:predicted  nucleic acid-binding Zn-ribbon protein
MKKPKKAELMAKMARLMAEKAELLAALDCLTAEKIALNGRLARQKRELATARRRISSMEERISSMEKRFELITLLAAPSPGCSTTARMVASLELPRPSRRREGGSGVRPATLSVDQGAPERRVG